MAKTKKFCDYEKYQIQVSPEWKQVYPRYQDHKKTSVCMSWCLPSRSHSEGKQTAANVGKQVNLGSKESPYPESEIRMLDLRHKRADLTCSEAGGTSCTTCHTTISKVGTMKLTPIPFAETYSVTCDHRIHTYTSLDLENCNSNRINREPGVRYAMQFSAE